MKRKGNCVIGRTYKWRRVSGYHTEKAGMSGKRVTEITRVRIFVLCNYCVENKLFIKHFFFLDKNAKKQFVI